MLRNVFIFLGCAAIAVPAAAVGFDKLELFRALGLAEGQWTSVVTVEDIVIAPAPGASGGPDIDQAIRDAKGQIGRTFETTDCLGRGLAANGDLILPGVAVDRQCSITERAVETGNFTFTARCGQSSHIVLSMAATKSDGIMQGTATASITGERKVMTFKTRINSRLTGECPPS
jgi:hypothetical protein